MAGYSIRPAGAEDLWLAIDVIGASCLERGLVELEAAAETELRRVAQDYRSAGGEFWVLESDGAVRGCVGLRPDPQGGGELRWWCLVRSWRGLGLGRVLVDTAATHGRSAGLRPLWAVLPAGLAEFAAFLSKTGFRPAAAPTWVVLPEGSTYHCLSKDIESEEVKQA